MVISNIKVKVYVATVSPSCKCTAILQLERTSVYFFCVQSTQYNRTEELTLFSYSLYLSNNNHTQTFSYFELFKSQQGGLKWDDFYRSFNACALFKS